MVHYFLTPYLFDIKEYLKTKSKKIFIIGLMFVLFIIIIFSNFILFLNGYVVIL